MGANLGRRRDAGAGAFARRVARALDGRRLGAVALVTVLLSAEALSGSEVLDFFSPMEIAVLWLEHLLELAVLAGILAFAYTLVEEGPFRHRPRSRLAACCATLLVLSVALTVLLHAYYAHGFEQLPPPGRLLADSLRFGLPALFLALVADMHRRAVRAASAARAAEITGAQLRDDEADQQLALLQAQIEPHFLFNVLGNVRRLYRTQPQAGAEAIRSLMRYLRGALPQLRTHSTSLGSELDFVRAYLDLLEMRMGPRLAYSIESDPALDGIEFPPMLIITLVENAIIHGIEPVGGGTVCVRTRCEAGTLHVDVLDDGAGLAAAGSDGKGVGLVNVRRQLAARYRGRARLTLAGRVPRGTRATISIPVGDARTGTWRSGRELAA